MEAQIINEKITRLESELRMDIEGIKSDLKKLINLVDKMNTVTIPRHNKANNNHTPTNTVMLSLVVYLSVINTQIITAAKADSFLALNPPLSLWKLSNVCCTILPIISITRLHSLTLS